MSKIERVNVETLNLIQEWYEKLKELFPEVFTEGKIDFDKLRATLGELVDNRPERYLFTWAGKTEAIRNLQTPSWATLKSCPEDSIDFNKTSNVFIEGENLEVLKLLLKSYFGRVKMIYIDPPYNGDDDLIYRDNYREPVKAYLQQTGQIDGNGNHLTSKLETNGRYHSVWLTMMYPRLFLARQLLHEKGFIFVSIDDNELSNLLLIMNEIFGEENYLNTVSVKAKPSAGASGGGEDKRLKKNIEYLVIYAKNKEKSSLRLDETHEEVDLFEHIQNMRFEGKSWKYTRVLLSEGEKVFVKKITDGAGDEISIYRHTNFRIEPISTLIAMEAEEKGVDINDEEAKWIIEQTVYRKYFNKVFRDTNSQSSIRTRVMEALDEDDDGLFSIEYVPKSGKNKDKLTTVYYKGKKKDQIAWLSDIAETRGEQIILQGRLGTLWQNFNWNNVSKEGDMPFPNGKKPIAFIKQMLSLATTPHTNDIILDFFAGSGSTGHAVIDMNHEDEGNRRFILVQLPESLPEDSKLREYGFETVSKVGIERLRRAIDKLNQDHPDLEGKEDRGFKVFKLASSNFKQWEEYTGDDVKEYTKQLSFFQTTLVDDYRDIDVIYEVILKEGYDLNSKIERIETVTVNTVYRITDPVRDQFFYLCLDEQVKPEALEALALEKDNLFICLDTALDDTGKANLALQCRLKTM